MPEAILLKIGRMTAIDLRWSVMLQRDICFFVSIGSCLCLRILCTSNVAFVV
jgi:hypothetical protein